MYFIKKIITAIFLSLSFQANAKTYNYIVKKNNGSVKFFATGSPSSLRINGVGVSPEGNIEISHDEKSSKVQGSFNFDLSTLNSGIEMRDSHMKEKYLELEKFPVSKLSINPIFINEDILKSKSKIQSEFKGTLNLHGLENKVVGATEFTLTNDQLKILAKFKIKSSDYKIETPSFAGITLADEIEIEVELNLLNSKGY